MLFAVDAQYTDSCAGVAGVGFSDWDAPSAQFEVTTLVQPIEPYTPGEFWRRELPCILAILDKAPARPNIIVVDGYVWLDSDGRKGLGARLFDALKGEVAVVGVAKRPFHGASGATPVLRGKSREPLFVTAQGISVDIAERGLRAMSGAHRTPTLLGRVDRLAREAAEKALEDGGSLHVASRSETARPFPGRQTAVNPRRSGK